MNKVWAKIDWCTLAGVLFIVLVGAIVFQVKYEIIRPIEWIGHADAAAYAEMADSPCMGVERKWITSVSTS